MLPWAETEVEGCGAVGCVRVGLDGDGNGNGFAGGGGEDGADVDVVDADVWRGVVVQAGVRASAWDDVAVVPGPV